MGENYFSREFYDLAITEYEKGLEKDPNRRITLSTRPSDVGADGGSEQGG